MPASPACPSPLPNPSTPVALGAEHSVLVTTRIEMLVIMCGGEEGTCVRNGEKQVGHTVLDVEL